MITKEQRDFCRALVEFLRKEEKEGRIKFGVRLESPILLCFANNRSSEIARLALNFLMELINTKNLINSPAPEVFLETVEGFLAIFDELDGAKPADMSINHPPQPSHSLPPVGEEDSNVPF